MLNNIISYDHQLNLSPPMGFLESTPAYNSILITYNTNLTTFEHLKEELMLLQTIPSIPISESVYHNIPVQYNNVVGLDLQYLSEVLEISASDIIAIHSATIYDVHFIGFLPGFMYLGGLDRRLHCARRNTPRLNVPQGSIAIGGAQTGIYPIASPGGWHIIGRTNLRIFYDQNDPPVAYKMGDKIQFIPT